MASAAQFKLPSGLAFDQIVGDANNGNVYVADSGNHTIRLLITGSAPTVVTLAGVPGVSGTDDGVGSSALFNSPSGLALDEFGDLFVADTGNNVIREITFSGSGAGTVASVSTIAGADGVAGYLDNVPFGEPPNAEFNHPLGLAIDNTPGDINEGVLYVADAGNAAIRTVDTSDVDEVGTLTVTPGPTTGNPALYSHPAGIALDRNNNIYVADSGRSTVLGITPQGVISTIGGLGGMLENTNGPANESRFYGPLALGVDAAMYANVYVADSGNDRIALGMPVPVINVTQNGNPILSSGTSTTNFGVIPVHEAAGITYNIQNNGAAPLILQNIGDTGSNASEFIVGVPTTGTLAPGSSAAVTVTFTPAGSGMRIANFAIASNDPISGLIPVALIGTGVASGNPSIAVEEPAGTYLSNGLNATPFGGVFLNSSNTIQYAIANQGIGALGNISLNITGNDASDFSFNGPEQGSVTSGNSTGFSVTFTPTAVGPRSATLHITSNDPNQPSFTVALSGAGLSYKQLAGTYTGLLDGNSGIVTLTFGKNGMFTGKLSFNGMNYPIIGALDAEGMFNGSVGFPPVSISIAADLTGMTTGSNGKAITGVINGNEAFAAFSTQNVKGQPAKTYNLLLNPTQPYPSIPQGIGYARLLESKSGGVTLAGSLADGTPFTTPCALVGGTNNTMVALSLVTKELQLSGNIGISGSTCNGLFYWVKYPAKKGAYSSGFITTLGVNGAAYVAPKAGIPAITFGNPNDAAITIMGVAVTGTSSAPAVKPVSASGAFALETNNHFVATSSNPQNIQVQITPGTGLFSGSFNPPGSTKRVGISGAVLTNPLAPQAGGYFLTPLLSGTSYNGGVTIAP